MLASTLISGVLILLLAALAAFKREKTETFKIAIFSLIAVVALANTSYLAGSTIYLNLISQSEGPVHWHADFRIFNCGEEVFLEEPRGFSNRIGTPDLHEHGDGRIHIEGVVVRKEDFSLGSFFEALGGRLSARELIFPGREGLVKLAEGELCPDKRPGRLQVFIYTTEDGKVRQRKLENFTEYVISPHSQVPPGDCLIFEFTPEEKEKTDKICKFYELAK